MSHQVNDDYFTVSQAPSAAATPDGLKLPGLSPDPHQTPTLENDQPTVFVQRPLPIYLMLLVFLVLIVFLPVIFCIALGQSAGGIPAPRDIAKLSATSPRVTAQLVTILASALAASVNWARAGAVTLLVQKRFQHLHPIFEIEAFSALKNGAIAWDLKRRQGLMLGTALVVILCGLLTSGFVALLSPFPIVLRSDMALNGELDLGSLSSTCSSWANATIQNLYCPDGSGSCVNDCGRVLRYQDSDFVYTACPVQDQLGEVLNAAKSSMIYRFASSLAPERRTNLISSYTQLANSRIIGSTAGTVPTGPAGVRVFTQSSFPNISDSTLSYNYTLELQGLWADVSCTYTDDNSTKLAVYPDDSGWISYQVSCPGESLLSPTRLANETSRNGLLLAGACIEQPNDEFTVHMRSFINWGDYDNDTIPDPNGSGTQPTVTPRSLPDDSPLTVGLSSFTHHKRQYEYGDMSNWAYAGVDDMVCSLKPRVGPVEAAYQTELAAFNMTPSQNFVPYSKMGELSTAIAREAMYETLVAITDGQMEWTGNLLGGLIRSASISYGNLDGGTKNEIFTRLVADALKGMFEYEVTHQRLILTAANPDQSCQVPVTGTLLERSIGWNIQTTTLVALIPLLLIGTMSIGMIIWTMRSKDELTIFDPTSAVSLIAATSVGDVKFAETEDQVVFGDPEDEIVRSTKVVYGYHDGRWGLKSSL